MIRLLTQVYHFVPCDRKECKKNDQRQQRHLSRVAQHIDYVQRAQRLCFSCSTPCVSAYTVDAATSTFSPRLSDHTLEGHPFLSTAATKSAFTVAARLFVEQLK